MTDDTSNTDLTDRSKFSAKEEYEARFFAQEAGISLEEAEMLIERCGNDRETLMREAGKLVKKAS